MSGLTLLAIWKNIFHIVHGELLVQITMVLFLILHTGPSWPRLPAEVLSPNLISLPCFIALPVLVTSIWYINRDGSSRSRQNKSTKSALLIPLIHRFTPEPWNIPVENTQKDQTISFDSQEKNRNTFWFFTPKRSSFSSVLNKMSKLRHKNIE